MIGYREINLLLVSSSKNLLEVNVTKFYTVSPMCFPLYKCLAMFLMVFSFAVCHVLINDKRNVHAKLAFKKRNLYKLMLSTSLKSMKKTLSHLFDCDLISNLTLKYNRVYILDSFFLQ